MTRDANGYPTAWQSEDPGPYPLGMPIWRDSWGEPPPLVYYGNGTLDPGPLLPVRYIAQTTTNYNAGVGPALESLPLSVLMKPSVLPKPTLADYVPIIPFGPLMNRNPPIGAANVASLNSMGLGGGNFLYQTQQQRAGIQAYNLGPVNSRVGDIISAASGLCEGLPPAYKTACQAAAAVGTAIVGGTSGAVASSVLNPGTLAGGCPPGFILVLGKCVAPQNALPGGQPLTLGGGAVATQGGLGLTAVTPTQVGTITRNDGSTGPILRCPRRYVLGQDYLCYPKSMIPNQLRAHPRGTRPLLTGGEVKIMRKAQSLSKKVGKLGTKFGPKHCHCSKPTSRRKK